VKNPRRARGYSRPALFTVIVATDKPVAFPRRLIISRRKRKGLSRARAQPLPLRHYPPAPCIQPRTYVARLHARTFTDTRDALLLDYIFNPPSLCRRHRRPPSLPPRQPCPPSPFGRPSSRPCASRPPPDLPQPTRAPTSSYVGTTPRRILYFRIPNGITMQEISFVIYARYKRAHFRLG